MTYFGTRLSENISRREPEGYLICLNVPVARTGVQDYLPSELGLPEPDSRLIPVLRPEAEIFSPACVASFEGMPVTDDHPSAPDGVTAENIRHLQKGHTQHVRRGSGDESDLLLADLIITDPALIAEILSGKREISCGYNYALCEEDGRLVQREIRGNHVAVVDAGRAGPRVSIRDRQAPAPRSGRPVTPASAPPPRAAQTTDADAERSKRNMKKNCLWPARLMTRLAKDGDAEGLSELIAEILEEPAGAEAAAEAAAEEPAPVLVDPPADQPVLVDCGPQILEALQQIISLLSGAPQADCSSRTRDEEPAPAEEAVTEAAAEAVAETAAPDLSDEDPVEKLVAEILQSGGEGESPLEPAPEAILSEILDPDDLSDEDPGNPEDPDHPMAAADALRAALAGFRPQLARMSPKDRQRFNADVAARLKKLTARAGSASRSGAYAALRGSAARDASDRALGQRIMASRNANLRS